VGGEDRGKGLSKGAVVRGWELGVDSPKRQVLARKEWEGRLGTVYEKKGAVRFRRVGNRHKAALPGSQRLCPVLHDTTSLENYLRRWKLHHDSRGPEGGIGPATFLNGQKSA